MPRSNRRHEHLVAEALRLWVQPGSAWRAENAVTERSLRIDFATRMDNAAPTWGVLQDVVAHRDVLVEAWGDTLKARGGLDAMLKLLGFARNAWPRDHAMPWTPSRTGLRAPMMLVVARRATRSMHDELGLQPLLVRSGLSRDCATPYPAAFGSRSSLQYHNDAEALVSGIADEVPQFVKVFEKVPQCTHSFRIHRNAYRA